MFCVKAALLAKRAFVVCFTSCVKAALLAKRAFVVCFTSCVKAALLAKRAFVVCFTSCVKAALLAKRAFVVCFTSCVKAALLAKRAFVVCFTSCVKAALLAKRAFVVCFTSLVSTRALRRVSNARVQATPGVGSVNFWSFTVAWTRGGGAFCVHTHCHRDAPVSSSDSEVPWLGGFGGHARACPSSTLEADTITEPRATSPLLCGGGGGGMDARRRRGGGVGEMGFRVGPFVLCKNGCWRRNTTFGPKKFFPPKSPPPPTFE